MKKITTLIITFSMGILFMMIGNYLSKTRSNFFIGIRTPWTLSSDAVWQKTHRLAGKLFMLSGLTIVIFCLFMPIANIGTLITFTVLPAALIPCIYSWKLWKEEQSNEQMGQHRSQRDNSNRAIEKLATYKPRYIDLAQLLQLTFSTTK